MKTVICFEYENEKGINPLCKLIDLPFAPSVGMTINTILSRPDYTRGQSPGQQANTIVKEVFWDELGAILLVVVELDPHWEVISFDDFDLSIWEVTEWPEFLSKLKSSL